MHWRVVLRSCWRSCAGLCEVQRGTQAAESDTCEVQAGCVCAFKLTVTPVAPVPLLLLVDSVHCCKRRAVRSVLTVIATCVLLPQPTAQSAHHLSLLRASRCTLHTMGYVRVEEVSAALAAHRRRKS